MTDVSLLCSLTRVKLAARFMRHLWIYTIVTICWSISTFPSRSSKILDPPCTHAFTTPGIPWLPAVSARSAQQLCHPASLHDMSPWLEPEQQSFFLCVAGPGFGAFRLFLPMLLVVMWTARKKFRWMCFIRHDWRRLWWTTILWHARELDHKSGQTLWLLSVW